MSEKELLKWRLISDYNQRLHLVSMRFTIDGCLEINLRGGGRAMAVNNPYKPPEEKTDILVQWLS